MDLTPVTERFVVHWGEMGSRWGVNRTVAQIHALLYLTPSPLHAEEIAGTLSVARSNVSTSLRELQGWGVVRVVHVLGDRRDHFECMTDVWEMFRVIVEERKRREIDPTLKVLRECAAAAQQPGSGDTACTKERIGDLLAFLDTMTGWYDQVSRLPAEAVVGFIEQAAAMLGSTQADA